MLKFHKNSITLTSLTLNINENWTLSLLLHFIAYREETEKNQGELFPICTWIRIGIPLATQRKAILVPSSDTDCSISNTGIGAELHCHTLKSNSECCYFYQDTCK